MARVHTVNGCDVEECWIDDALGPRTKSCALERILGREPRGADAATRFAHIDELWADPDVLKRTR